MPTSVATAGAQPPLARCHRISTPWPAIVRISTAFILCQVHVRNMQLSIRHNVHVTGEGRTTLFLAHGFGCDQNMWRLLVPSFSSRYRIVLFDLVGSGSSDLAAYDRSKYASLQGHADDVLDLLAEFGSETNIFVGHSVSAMIGVLAQHKVNDAFDAHVMVGPSPCYINDAEYVGGFEQRDIDSLLDTLEGNYLGWSSNMAPAIMGAPDQPELGVELTNSFCRTDPEIAAHFARVTFLSDHRAELPSLRCPTLIIQCSDDIIAPQSVGQYMAAVLPDAALQVVDNIGHCPHLSRPDACTSLINSFLAERGL